MSNMRGLTVFISDIRNARARESEERRINTELAKIRAKFRETKLNGYERKKYVSKLLYMYILGWDVEFGHLEAVNLISSTKYSEKQIGYLGVTLLLHENHELIHLVVNSIRKDLLDNNELFNCLALHCIANIGGVEMGTALSRDVHQLLIDPTSKSFVKKKAALTLLRLYRKNPQILQKEWTDRIISLMDDPDLGVTLAIVSLVTALAQDTPESFAAAFPKAVRTLNRVVVEQEYDSGYLYYKVPIPWLQIKLLRLMLAYQSPSDILLHALLSDTLKLIIARSGEVVKNAQQSNAQNAVFFQAIAVAVHIEADKAILDQTLNLLDKFIISKETNVRYLGLETMSLLARNVDLIGPMKRHRSVIMHSLNDRDISVRRRGLDLLYSICDSQNAKEIVDDLIRYLRTSEYAMREETVLKIAILVEKYTTKLEWYIDVTLQLLAIAGDHVADEVWQRIVQIVANNEALQEHASRSVLTYMQTAKCHENLVKVAGFVLGEFGHLIANDQNCSPIEQFSALHSKFNLASSFTRAILLSTYIKFVNLFPEIKAEVLLVFRQFSEVLDPELQQRACEYLYIASLPDDHLLQVLCEEMPPYPERSSRLISRLYSGGDEQLLPTIAYRPSPIMSKELFDATTLDRNGSHTPQALHEPIATSRTGQDTSLSANWEPGFRRLVWKDNGILYDDAQFCVMVRSSYEGFRGSLVLYIKNKSSFAYTSFSVMTQSSNQLSIQAANLAQPELEAQSQNEQAFDLVCLGIFHSEPTVKISYFAGAFQTITLKLPITMNKFLKPASISNPAEFSNEWGRVGSQSVDFHRSFTLVDGRDSMDMNRLVSIVTGMKWTLLAGTHENATTVYGTGMLQTRDLGNICVLLRIETLVHDSQLRLTVRSSSNGAAAILEAHLTDCFSSFLPVSRAE